MTSTESFFTNSTDGFERREIQTGKETPEAQVDNVYEIQRCASWIQSREYKQVALQFPDDMMCDSVTVVSRLQAALTTSSANLFILGDTSYGSCCVDEVAGEHYNADCLIHFGRSCLSGTGRLPVLYVFGQKALDIEDCVDKFSSLFPDPDSHVIVMCDTVYSYISDDVVSALKDRYPSVAAAGLALPAGVDTDGGEERQGADTVIPDTNCVERCGRKIPPTVSPSLESYSVFYIGAESLTLTNLMLSYKECPFYSYNPENKVGRKENFNVNKTLMKRYYMVERAKDANIVGILVGTLGVANYLDILQRLKSLIKLAGKKSYTFIVGKINVPKLANFMEVDVFVLIACAENTLLDSSDFYKPVVTPYEMELACNTTREWTADYPTAFSGLLPGGRHYVPLPDSLSDSDSTDVSLITGKLRRAGTGDLPPETGTAIVSRSDLMGLATQAESAGEFLKARSWQGLQQDLGQTPVTAAIEGTTGIAMGYTTEPGNNTQK